MRFKSSGFLRFLMCAGILMMLIGPCSYGQNEGFGGSPGSLSVSLFWRRATYVLVPLGAAISLGAAIVLFAKDRNRRGPQS